MASKNATLKDVAELAGVSTATVARVLHDNGYVADITRQQVLEAVAQTGYRINVIAQGLRKQRTFTIGHFLNSLFPNPFFVEVAAGVEQAALAKGYTVLIFNVQQSAEQERRGIELFIQRRVDAIIFTTPQSAENVELALREGILVVQIERPMPVVSNAVLVDQYTGAIEAMEHLIALGHRQIAFWGEKPKSVIPSSAQWCNVELDRFTGYTDTLKKHRLPIQNDVIFLQDHYPTNANENAQQGDQIVSKLLRARPDCTAIFAASDLMAASVLQSLYKRGLHVPRDMSVIGFDNTLSAHLTPPLTTVALPMLEMGSEAVRIIVEHLDTENTSAHSVSTLTARLIARDSTGKAQK